MGTLLGLGIFIAIGTVILTFTFIVIIIKGDEYDEIQTAFIVSTVIVILIASVVVGHFLMNPENFGYQKIEQETSQEE